MQPKFRVGQKVVRETEWSKRYMVVTAVIDCGEWVEYMLSGYATNSIQESDGLRNPTDFEIGTYY